MQRRPPQGQPGLVSHGSTAEAARLALWRALRDLRDESPPRHPVNHGPRSSEVRPWPPDAWQSGAQEC
eukprot:scaffold20325_cov130-Isochrysis_galbana.AAC.4